MRIKSLLASTISILMGAFAPSDAYDEPGSCRIEYAREALSVACDSEELTVVLEGIERKTGVVFHLDTTLRDKISIHVSEASLVDAIRAVLAGYSYVSLYDKSPQGEKRLSSVRILPKSNSSHRIAEETVPSVALLDRDGSAEEKSDAVSITRDPSGHFITSGEINSVPVEFLIDTGATLVAVPMQLADEIRLAYERETTIQTANGQANGFLTTLGRVELGSLAVENVPGIILPNMGTRRRVLIGNNFLSAFELFQTGDVLRIRRPDARTR